jgi:hypothetical protein
LCARTKFAQFSLPNEIREGANAQKWCRRRDLNPRPPAYEADALPLSYAG